MCALPELPFGPGLHGGESGGTETENSAKSRTWVFWLAARGLDRPREMSDFRAACDLRLLSLLRVLPGVAASVGSLLCLWCWLLAFLPLAGSLPKLA